MTWVELVRIGFYLGVGLTLTKVVMSVAEFVLTLVVAFIYGLFAGE